VELIVIRGEDIISLFFIVLTGTLLEQTLITKSLSLMMPSGLPFPLTTTNELGQCLVQSIIYHILYDILILI